MALCYLAEVKMRVRFPPLAPNSCRLARAGCSGTVHTRATMGSIPSPATKLCWCYGVTFSQPWPIEPKNVFGMWAMESLADGPVLVQAQPPTRPCGCSSVGERDLAKVEVEGSIPFIRSK